TGKIAHGTIVVDGRAVEPDHPYLVRHGIEGFAKALIAELKRQRGQHRGSPASPRSWRGTRSLARGGGRGACPQRVRSRFTLARWGLLAWSGCVHHALLGLRMPAPRALGRNAPPRRQAARVTPLRTQSSSSASFKFHNRRMRRLKCSCKIMPRTRAGVINST